MLITHDESLILLFVFKVQRLAGRADAGHNVAAEIKALVEEACDCFATTLNTDATANRDAFKYRLKLYAALAHSSRPQLKNAFEFAASLVNGTHPR
ncbi:hypothetical protein RGU75_13650 [Glaciimonas sp. CA11.2]|uniref:hypothetical protein n=2 Tax=Glaciimonas sp. CA11.2 TaxID=3048601 RepID=UPI002AB4A6C2|nr:hypothetical protein [Glaciimonas sp. CA11.2]MDY7547272.1 hypothetical protein [Glaciimonas sp. CA11.2]